MTTGLPIVSSWSRFTGLLLVILLSVFVSRSVIHAQDPSSSGGDEFNSNGDDSGGGGGTLLLLRAFPAGRMHSKTERGAETPHPPFSKGSFVR